MLDRARQRREALAKMMSDTPVRKRAVEFEQDDLNSCDLNQEISDG